MPAALSEDPTTKPHPALEGLENVTQFSKQTILERTRLAQLAVSYGINRVVRWKPRKVDNLKGSGEETVLAHTMYSIIGALALQKGGEIAARTARERILRPMGLK
jgi:large subunit ribosomal protein L15